MFQAGLAIFLLAVFGIPFLIFWFTLLLAGGVSTLIALGSLLIVLVIAGLVSQ